MRLAIVATLVAAATAFTGPSDPKRFKFYDTPSKGGICDGDVGPDGVTLWYQDLLANTIGRINYKTGAIHEWPVPFQKNRKSTSPQVGNVTALACVIRTGKDGLVYGGAGIHNELVVIYPGKTTDDVKNVKVYVYSPAHQNPAGNLENFNDAWAANEGLWFSQVTGNVVSVFLYSTHKFKSFKAHTPLSGPLGMRTDKHNNLWYTNFFGQFISVINTKTFQITEYLTCCLPTGLFPEVLRSSTENQKYLWANAFGSGGYIRIEPDAPDNEKFHVFLNPDGAGTFPFENSNDYCGRIWYTSPVQNILVYYTPNENKWTTVRVPGIPLAGNFEVIMHRGPGPYMWFCETVTNKIGRYTLDKSCKGEPQ